MRGVGIIRRTGYAVSYSVPFCQAQGVVPAGEAVVRIFPRDFAIPVIYSLHPNCRTPLESKRNARFATAEFLKKRHGSLSGIASMGVGARWRVDCHDCHGIEESKSPRLGYPGARLEWSQKWTVAVV
jgi:hypothetical protein